MLPDLVLFVYCATKTNGPTERVFPLENTSCRPPVGYTEIIKGQDKKVEQNISDSES